MTVITMQMLGPHSQIRFSGPPGVLLKDAGQGVWLRMSSAIISKRDK